MGPLTKIALLTGALLVAPTAAAAQDFEAGVAAAKAGDYETPL